MQLTLKIVSKKKLWEEFLLEQEETPFFQSWAWGEVQYAIGIPVYRFGLFRANKLLSIAQVIYLRARRGNYYHIRHGPVMNVWSWETFSDFIKGITTYAKQDRALFIRVSPLVGTEGITLTTLKLLGFQNSPVHNLDGETSWVLPLDKSEDQLLAGMRKTTRYLIKKASKIGVVVEKREDEVSFKEFLSLYHSTSKRQHFVPHKGIWEEFELFKKENAISLFLARYQNKVLAASLIIFYGNQAVYHHSGADLSFSQIPASYLLQWEIIKEAKHRGMKQYNFWGVAPPEKPNHPWRGLTIFKTGFGGELKRYIHAQDLPLSPKYLATNLIETVFRIKKGYW